MRKVRNIICVIRVRVFYLQLFRDPKTISAESHFEDVYVVRIKEVPNPQSLKARVLLSSLPMNIKSCVVR